MRKVFVLAMLAMVAFAFTACNKTKAVEENAEDVYEKVSLADLFTDAEDQYPRDLGLFDNDAFKARLWEVTGDEYDEIVANFNVQTPVEVADGVYKFNGGKTNAVPEFNTTIYYDSKNDNLNVVVTRNGESVLYVEPEGEEIEIPEALLENEE